MINIEQAPAPPPPPVIVPVQQKAESMNWSVPKVNFRRRDGLFEL